MASSQAPGIVHRHAQAARGAGSGQFGQGAFLLLAQRALLGFQHEAAALVEVNVAGAGGAIAVLEDRLVLKGVSRGGIIGRVGLGASTLRRAQSLIRKGLELARSLPPEGFQRSMNCSTASAITQAPRFYLVTTSQGIIAQDLGAAQ